MATLAAHAANSHAASYPTRPVVLVVPFPAGGAVDIIGRLVSKSMGDALGQPVVIENRAGAGASGVAIAFCDPSESKYLRDIERLLKMSLLHIGLRRFNFAFPSTAYGSTGQPSSLTGRCANLLSCEGPAWPNAIFLWRLFARPNVIVTN